MKGIVLVTEALYDEWRADHPESLPFLPSPLVQKSPTFLRALWCNAISSTISCIQLGRTRSVATTDPDRSEPNEF